MFNIASYLDKFKNLGLKERLLKELIKEAVKEATRVNIEIKDINIKKDEIIFKVSPAIKNTLYIKKELILSKIKEKNTKEMINNLR
jgi:hypothetical protein